MKNFLYFILGLSIVACSGTVCAYVDSDYDCSKADDDPYSTNNIKKSFFCFKKMCDYYSNSVPYACYNVGMYYFRGLGVKQNLAQAGKYLKIACDLNYGKGCDNLGYLYLNPNGAAHDYANARKYYEKGCNLDDGLSCYNLGFIYHGGHGVRKDFVKARQYYEKSCKRNIGDGCVKLGFFYYRGIAVRQNITKAKEYLGKGCVLGNQVGCDAYKELNELGY